MKNTKIFAKTFEQEAFEQVYALSNSEAYKESKIRIMPDAHAGKGCTIGTTMTIEDKVTPNLVGVDIGCGMYAVSLFNKKLDFALIDTFIKRHIPYGKAVNEDALVDFDFSNLVVKDQVDLDRANLSIGTLGGGNHFIEIAKSEKLGNLWLIIHSGSRSLGHKVCQIYQKKAIDNLKNSRYDVKEMISSLKKEGRHKEIAEKIKAIKQPAINEQLAHLEGKDFDNYVNDMEIVQRYAAANREHIAFRIIEKFDLVVRDSFHTIHNYIDFVRMILRKGSVSAELGEALLIPINMRDGSLLCIGKGNEDWNFSAPHGAGRLMSRSKAKELLDMDEFRQQMKDVYTTSVSESTLDEAPGAYKSIEEIKESVVDTVDVIDTLVPLYNFKA